MMALGFLLSFAYPVQYSGTTDTRVQFFHIINIENKKNLSYHQTRSSAASLHLLQEHHLAPDHGDRNAMLCILEATIANSLSSSLFFSLFFIASPHCLSHEVCLVYYHYQPWSSDYHLQHVIQCPIQEVYTGFTHKLAVFIGRKHVPCLL